MAIQTPVGFRGGNRGNGPRQWHGTGLGNTPNANGGSRSFRRDGGSPRQPDQGDTPRQNTTPMTLETREEDMCFAPPPSLIPLIQCDGANSPPEEFLEGPLACMTRRMDVIEHLLTELFDNPERNTDVPHGLYEETSSLYEEGNRRSSYYVPVLGLCPDYRRKTMFTDGGTAVSHRKPKMEKPESFLGKYKVTYCMLNWLRVVRKYLKQHNI